MSNYIHDPEEWAAKCVDDPRWLAECLERIGRFGGQHPTASVLMHSLEVWWMCRHESQQTQLWALMHDAHEAVTGDIPRPVKHAGMFHKQAVLDDVLLRHLGITAEYATVAVFDKICGDAEHAQWGDTLWQHGYAPEEAVQVFDTKARRLMAVIAATAKVQP